MSELVSCEKCKLVLKQENALKGNYGKHGMIEIICIACYNKLKEVV